MRPYSLKATLKSLQKFEKYELVSLQNEIEEITREQAETLARKAMMIQSPGEILKDKDFLLMLWLRKERVYLKKCEDYIMKGKNDGHDT